jgi:hypothetical protein
LREEFGYLCSYAIKDIEITKWERSWSTKIDPECRIDGLTTHRREIQGENQLKIDEGFRKVER